MFNFFRLMRNKTVHFQLLIFFPWQWSTLPPACLYEMDFFRFLQMYCLSLHPLLLLTLLQLSKG